MLPRNVVFWFAFITVTATQMPPKPPIIPLINDIPFIKCDVCQKAAKVIFKSVKSTRKALTTLKLSEDDILDIVEKSCNPDSGNNGEWIARLDIVELDNGLILQEHSNIGKCREECKTIQRSCEDTVGEVDTDIGEILWKNEMKLPKFIDQVCYRLTDACAKNKKKYKKGKRKDFIFSEMTEKDLEAAKLMKSMRGAPGMPGLEMYTPEDLESMRDQLGLDDLKPSAGSVNQELPKDLPDDIVEEKAYTTSASLGFFDTIKAMGSDILMKIKRFFGYKQKSEL